MTHFKFKFNLIVFFIGIFTFNAIGQDNYCFKDSMYKTATFSLPELISEPTNFIVLKDGEKGFFAIETTKRKHPFLGRHFEIKGNAEIILENGKKIKLIDRRYTSGLIPVPNDLTYLDCEDLKPIDAQRRIILSNNGLIEITNVFKLTEREISLLKQHRIATVSYTIRGLKYFEKAQPSINQITVFNAFLEDKKVDTRELFKNLFSE